LLFGGVISVIQKGRPESAFRNLGVLCYIVDILDGIDLDRKKCLQQLALP